MVDDAQSPRIADEMSTAQKWVLFAGLMFGYAALAGFIGGIASLVGSRISLTGTDYLLAARVHASGWFEIGLAVLQYVAAFLIWTGRPAGRVFGIVLACASIVGALLMSDTAPLKSLLILILSALIVYGLVRYGAAAIEEA